MQKNNFGLKDPEYVLAKELINEEYFVDAIKILQKLHKNNSSSQALKFELALAWATSGIAVDRAEKYFKKLIKDDGRLSDISRIELARILLCKKNYNEARDNLEIASKNKKLMLYALSELFYLALREEKYEEAKSLYNIIKYDDNYWTSVRKTQIETYLNYKLGKIDSNNNFDNYYFGSQLLNYSDDRAIEHIKLHLDEDDDKQVHSTYLEDTNIEKLYEESKTRITSINPSVICVVDKYILDFDKPIGIIKNEETDVVSVVTIPNTYDILSIYPVYNYKTRVKKRN